MTRREGDELAQAFTQPPAAIFPTGFPDLDSSLGGGLRAGQSTLVGGFTGHAKSAFGEQVALDTSIETETLYLTLEMGERETRLRMAAKIARTSLAIFERSGLDTMTKQALNSRKLTIFKPKQRTIEMIEKLVARAAHKIIVIDDCRSITGVLMGATRGGSDAHRIAERLTLIAEEYGVHMLMLHQLDPLTFNVGPDHWRFQDSRVFEQKAYNVLTVYRPFIYRGKAQDTVAEVRVRKCRRGSLVKLHYRWVGDTMSFWALNEYELANLECCKSKVPRAS